LDSDLTRPLQPTSVQVSSLPKNQSCPWVPVSDCTWPCTESYLNM
jgi:hypothetical protein